MSITQFYQGNLIDVFGTFTNEAGAATDPTTVKFQWACGTAAPTTYTYSGSSTPATASVWRTGTGTYTARVDTTGLVGTLNMSYESTGTAQAVGVTVVSIVTNPASV